MANKINHLDLFSGIGGFAYAVDQVWPGSTHVFCDNNLFCQQVLAKHWPESKIYGDIRSITDTKSWEPRKQTQQEGGKDTGGGSKEWVTDLLTGGFPCQPFSQAGKRRGTSDERYLWPEMFRVIQLTKPTWVIAENVRGLVTWNEGLVLEQVCLDLENEGYEVQPLIIPACAVNAPHRRDRIWIIAHSTSKPEGDTKRSRISETQPEGFGRHRQDSCNEDWEKNWIEVAASLCRVDDGVSRRVDRLRALGNAIVPQVAEMIMRGIWQIK